VFTPGFRLFGGLAVIGLISAVVYGLSSGDVSGPDYFGFIDRNAVIGLVSLGWKGNVGAASGFMVLIFMSMSAALIGGTVVAFRDADVESVAELGDTPSVMPLAQRPTAPSWWPAITAIGLGVLLIGLVMDTKAFWIIGLVLLAAVAIEWALTAWADRSTGDASTNEALRDRVGSSFEIPLLGVAGGAIIALAVSRILLWSSLLGAVIIAGVVGLVVFGVAILAAFRPQIGKRTLTTIIGILALTIVGLGIAAAAAGPREIHHEDEHGEEQSTEGTVENE
jgi:hypothetical protein